MKKIIFLALVLSGSIFAQATWTKYNKVEGRNNSQAKGDSLALMVYLMNNPSVTGTVSVTGVATSAKQDSLLVQLKGANKLFGETDTITVRTDTVTCTGASSWLTGSIIASDSIQIAINGSFTSGQVWVITETTKVDLPKWSAATSNKIYIKRYGNAGTPRYYLRLSGR